MNAKHLILAAALLCCALAVPGAAEEQQVNAKVTMQAAPAPSPEQTELAKLTAENQLADQRLKKKLQQVNSDKEELRAQYELDIQKQKAKTAELEAELARTASENKLADEKRKGEIARLETEYQKLASQNKLSAEQARALTSAQGDELSKLTLENKLAEEKNKKLMADLALQIAKLKAVNDLGAEQQRSDLLADSKEKNGIDLELKRLDLVERKLKIEKMALDSRLNRINSDLDLRMKKAEWKKESNTEPVYNANPFSNGKLVISDRRIALNGPIYTGVADNITERIHYFNNISSQPIFIVIDVCPGGSVMEGYRIVKAMQASKAPIYVVVKSFAASMAAVITTLADKSYVYPNSIILHHQMSTGFRGNMTQLKEQLEMSREWERRLHVPVSKKMGISPDEFRKKMYEKNSDGDWEEFGDKAVEYKWATSTVDEIDETGFVKNPDEKDAGRPMGRFSFNAGLEEKTDEKGERFVSLPRLTPFDFYFIYNPNGYYR
ncbi:MAG: ATP-dependent Clp protease proteolytic subunit [Elusimicrobiales bacterium]|nr:ATP-dependent Clp protease proteolytic subunit [Elusimicrobiales bacterium]